MCPNPRHCCIVSNFYIKSQPIDTVNSSAARCIVSNFYIKSQPDKLRLKLSDRCIVSNFYIKSQPIVLSPQKLKVVQYPISTSNHNASPRIVTLSPVVQYPISTSNHNNGHSLRDALQLYSIQFLHQITTVLKGDRFSLLLYSIQFLHQITT